MSTLLLARIVSLPCPRFYDTTRTRHRGGDGAAFLPRKKRECCSSGCDGGRWCLALHPDLDNAAFTSTGLQKFGSTIQTRPTTPRSSSVSATKICPQQRSSLCLPCMSGRNGTKNQYDHAYWTARKCAMKNGFNTEIHRSLSSYRECTSLM